MISFYVLPTFEMAEQVSNPTASVNMDPPESDTKQIEDRIPDSSSEIPKGTTKPANEPAAKDEKEKIDEKKPFSEDTEQLLL